VSAIAVLCAEEPTEISVSLRTAYDLFDVCGLRLQAQVLSPGSADAVLELRYSLDGGATWDLASAGGTGPSLPLVAAGAISGALVNVAPLAAADVLLSVFVSGGDGSTVATIGSLNLFAQVAATRTGVCPEYEELNGCPPTPAVAFMEFAYPTLAAFYADLPLNDGLFAYWSGDSTNTARQFLDTADQFHGAKALVSKHGLGATDQNLYWWCEPNNSLLDASLEICIQLIMQIDLALAATVSSDVVDGFVVAKFYTNAGRSYACTLRNDRIYLVDNDTTASDVGPASDMCDARKQITFRLTMTGAGVLFRLYLDDPCPDPAPAATTYGSIGPAGPGVDDFVEHIAIQEFFSPELAGETRVWQFGYGNVADYEAF
jgi:hypothetical protein